MSHLVNSCLPFILLLMGSAPSLEDELASLQSCVDGFNVHHDKIIRTEDSREMGAKFLGEIDVDSRIGCMKWCCESKHCDVFVFEERKPGSCYLFHCGPPHDFKCKFTTHSNYSSAVLTNYDLQNAATLEEEIRRNQQEHELQSLRRQDSPGREYNGYFGETSSTTSMPPPAVPQPRPTTTTSTTPLPTKGATCNRNQFECRSNEDCIAIYNVCDGIAQCPDGSDEAAELSCPPERTTLSPAAHAPPAAALQPKPPFDPAAALLPELIRYQQIMEQHHAQYPIVFPDQPIGPMRPHHLPTTAEEYRLYQQQQQMQVAPVDDLSNSALVAQQQQMGFNRQLPSGYQWSGYPGSGAFNTDLVNKMPNQAQAPPVEPTARGFQQSYDQEPQSIRIYNHNKKPGTHLEDVESSNGAYSGPDPSHNNYAQYQPSGPARPVDSWQDNNGAANQAHQQQQVQSGANIVPVAPPQRHQPEQQQQQQQQPSPSEKQPETTITRQESSANGEKYVQRVADVGRQSDAEQPAVSQAKINSKPGPTQAQAAAAPGTIAPKSHDQLNLPQPQNSPVQPQQVHQQVHAMPAEAQFEQHKSLAIEDHIRRHGGIDELEMTRPRGAVISLALGLCVTAIMAVLIACRLRVVKRRGLRLGRHDAYAHDADYLVNGMYL